jgi:predicted house-cleaning NTP pyrophosphatase (Maf/HAM1 superfamily)
LAAGAAGAGPAGAAAGVAVGSEEPAVVVAGDAVVVKEERIFEKPRSHQEAMAFLHEFSGSALRFVTSLVVMRTDKQKVLSTVETSVDTIPGVGGARNPRLRDALSGAAVCGSV